MKEHGTSKEDFIDLDLSVPDLAKTAWFPEADEDNQQNIKMGAYSRVVASFHETRLDPAASTTAGLRVKGITP